MKMLVASTADAGHLNPLIAIAQAAQARGDEVVVTTGARAEARVREAGLRFCPRVPTASVTVRGRSSADENVTPQQELLDAMKHAFIDDMPAQVETLRQVIGDEKPDIVLSDLGFLGRLALFLDPGRPRIPLVCCGITYLTLDRPDGAPTPMGLPPARNEQDLANYARLAAEQDRAFNIPLRTYMNDKLEEMKLPKLAGSFSSSLTMLCDAYLHPTVPAFEYDYGRLPSHIHFIGSLPLPSGRTVMPPPTWWASRDHDRKVILVTQGTVANKDLSELIQPTIESLADRDDLLLIAITGGRPTDELPHPLPSNTRAIEYVDFNNFLPEASMLITNGGYGTVSAALRFGVPVIAAGRSEDKAEVGARVAWSGVGIEIPQQRASKEMLRGAVEKLLSDPSYLERARILSADIAKMDARLEALRIIDQVLQR